MAHDLLESNRGTLCGKPLAPAEIELLNEITPLQQAATAAPDAATKQELTRALVSRRTQLAIMLERGSPREK